MGESNAPDGSVRHDDYAARMGLILTVYPVSQESPGGREVVVLSSVRVERDGLFVAVAVASRMWVTDLEGTGLEHELMDPVVVLREAARDAGDEELQAFHMRAAAELRARRGVDFEVADLFAPEV
jgi:hypothetical protein